MGIKYVLGNKELISPSVNMISDGTVIKGDIIIKDFRLDGVLYGNIDCKGKLVIGSSGYIEGNIICHSAEIAGQVKGNINVTELLILKETSIISGDILTGKLIVESGANLNITCKTVNNEN